MFDCDVVVVIRVLMFFGWSMHISDDKSSGLSQNSEGLLWVVIHIHTSNKVELTSGGGIGGGGVSCFW